MGSLFVTMGIVPAMKICQPQKIDKLLTDILFGELKPWAESIVSSKGGMLYGLPVFFDNNQVLVIDTKGCDKIKNTLGVKSLNPELLFLQTAI